MSANPRNTGPSLTLDRNWRSRLNMSGEGDSARPEAIFLNCLIALRYAPEWNGVLVFNEFSHRLYINNKPPWGGRGNREWGENDDRKVCEWLQMQGIRISIPTASDAVLTIANENSFNPLIEYLANLEWDGTPRVDMWLPDYMGVQKSDYSTAVGRAWLISAVARAFRPGCKVDHVLVFEGPQGTYKSSAIESLAGSDFWTDQIPEDLSSKDASVLCSGVWIVEFPEFETIVSRPSKVQTVKAYLTRSDDRYRPHYAKHPTRVLRQCVFAASTNKKDYLIDETGGRRFWPVKCGYIDLFGIRRDRDQIWAEAIQLYYQGEKWWLDSDLEKKAALEQSNRFVTHPWQELIEKHLQGKYDTCNSEILDKCLHKSGELRTRADQMDVTKCLTALGWDQYKHKDGSRRFRRK